MTRTRVRPGAKASVQLRRLPSGGVPDSEADAATVRSRKKFARRQWARRWLRVRNVLVAVVVLGLLAGGVWALYGSDGLAVRNGEVVGAEGLSDTEVLDTAELSIGAPLVSANLDAIELRVESLAKVSDAAVSRKWPRTIRIEVTERAPIAVVEIGGRTASIDAEGVVFPTSKQMRNGLPRVRTEIGTSTDALAEVAAVVDALSADVAERVDFVSVETIDQISLTLRDGRTVRWGSADLSADKSLVLAALLDQEAKIYDVSVPEQPSVSR